MAKKTYTKQVNQFIFEKDVPKSSYLLRIINKNRNIFLKIIIKKIQIMSIVPRRGYFQQHL